MSADPESAEPGECAQPEVSIANLQRDMLPSGEKVVRILWSCGLWTTHLLTHEAGDDVEFNLAVLPTIQPHMWI